MKLNYPLPFFLFFLCQVTRTFAQDIVINEYFNTAGQNDEWVELVVVKDNLDLTGWYLGDNNAGTSNWQPKLQFKNHPLWKNLRAGTIIQIDHAANFGGCNDPVDVDKSDGFIRVCCRNTTYFDGGSTTTLFLADDGDFLQIVDPSGKMIHGLGHDDIPGTSVETGPCFSQTNLWTQTTSAQSATRPCGNFLFYRFKTSAPTSLYVAAGQNADFFAGMLSQTNNGLVDTSDTPFEGIGNGGANAPWLVNLRMPKMLAQNVCMQRSPQGVISFSWQAAEDAFPSDQTTGYLVLRNTTNDFPLPTQGIQYTLNQTVGNGNQLSTVVGILTGTAQTSFSENPGPGSYYYRVFPFRFVNTIGFQHFTRGRTYNTTQFVKVLNQDIPPYTLKNDTLCQAGKAVLALVFGPQPGPGGLAWYTTPIGGTPILVNQDTLKIDVAQTTSFWVEPSNLPLCQFSRIEVKAVVLPPFSINYTSSDSICEGTPAYFSVDNNPGWTYNWTVSGLDGITQTRPDSHGIAINIPSYPNRKWVYIWVQVKNEKGCTRNLKDSLQTVPFDPQLIATPSSPPANSPFLVSIQSSKQPALCFDWQNVGGQIFQKSFPSCQATTADSMIVGGYISSVLPNDGLFCRVYRSLKIKTEAPLKPIPNLITLNGDQKNEYLNLDYRQVLTLEIYDRWGKKIKSFGQDYTNQWPEADTQDGLYYYHLAYNFGNKIDLNSQTVTGWVWVVKPE